MLKKLNITEGVAALKSGKPGDTILCDIDRSIIVYGTSPKKRDTDAAQRMGYEVVSLPVPGGCVVFQPHDLIILHFSEKADDFFDLWSAALIQFLKDKGLDAFCSVGPFKMHHDILVKDRGITYKIGTHSQGPLTLDNYLCATALSFHIKERHIKRISVLSTQKPPRGLSTFNITIDEIQALFLDFMNRTYNEKISC